MFRPLPTNVGSIELGGVKIHGSKVNNIGGCGFSYSGPSLLMWALPSWVGSKFNGSKVNNMGGCGFFCSGPSL